MKPRILTLFMLLGLLGTTSMARAQSSWNSVTLHWTTSGDDSLVGTASSFDLRYSTSAITAANFASATRWTSMPAPGPSGQQQSVVVTGLQPGTLYYFALKTADEVPNWSGISNIITKATTAAPDTVRPFAIANVAVSALTDTTATLGWTATGDDSLTGTATTYDIRYSTTAITLANWGAATQVTGEPVPTAAGTNQSYTVRGLSRQVTYYFAIRVSDDAGNPSALSNVASATTLDTMPPAAVRDLAASFVWFGWNTSAVETRRVAMVGTR